MAKVPSDGASNATATKLAAAIKKAAEARKLATAAAKTAARARKAANAAAAKAATAAAKAKAAEGKVAAMRPEGTRSAPTQEFVTAARPVWLTEDSNLYSAALQETANTIAQWKVPDDPKQMNLLLDLSDLDSNQVWFLAFLIVGRAERVNATLSSAAELLQKLANEPTTLNEGPEH